MTFRPLHLGLSLALLTLATAPGRADGVSDAPPPTTVPALLPVLANAPALQALRSRAEAARARSAAAGRLPNPELEGMFSRAREPMGDEYPMWEVNLRQPLPKAGERAADRARAAAQVSMAEADFAIMAGEMAADTAMALAEAEAARSRVSVLQTQIERTERVLTALDTRLSSGAGRVADRLALQTRVAAMRLMIEQETRMADDTLAEARGRLGLAPDAALPAYSAPTTAEIDASAPSALRLAAARGEEAAAMAKMARASARPMNAIGLRFEREEQRMGNMDTIGVAFMTELPFRTRGAARAELAAARAEERAARSDGEAARHRARSALARAERAERLAAASRRLADETLSRLDAEYDSLVRSSGAPTGMGGESSVLMVLDLLERQTDARLQIIEAEAAARIARAELWRHAPATFFTTTTP